MKTPNFLFYAFTCFVSMLGYSQETNTTLSTVNSGTTGTAGATNVFIGYQSGSSCTTTATNCTFVGNKSGLANHNGYRNTFIGYEAGSSNYDASYNTYFGAFAGRNSTGSNNVFFGENAGLGVSGAANTSSRNVILGNDSGRNISGSDNVFVGNSSGFYTAGANNTFLGVNTGKNLATGDNNIMIGSSTGSALASGSNNVFIGYKAGSPETSASNKLYIANTTSPVTYPLIYGEFDNKKLKFNGQVGIGYGSWSFPATLSGGSVNISTYNLFVKGGILTDEIRVRTSWADYVFKKEYQLRSLPEVEKFITENGHLPNIPAAKQIEAEGVNLGEMVKLQQEKIEELTLYLIKQNKEMEAMKARMEQLERK